jgi:hypothetical protein
MERRVCCHPIANDSQRFLTPLPERSTQIINGHYAIAAAGAERRAQAIGALSCMFYALTHEELRGNLVTLNAGIYKRMEEELTKSFQRRELPMPPARLIPTLHALSDGLTFLRALMPELVTDAVIVAAFDALAGAMPRG